MADDRVSVTFTPMERDEFIKHYGVKGMKWGKRKASKPKPPTAAERKAEVKKMSDDELRKKINRIQMEKQYLKLTTPEPTGLKKVQKILSESSERQARQAIDGYLAKQVQEAFKGL